MSNNIKLKGISLPLMFPQPIDLKSYNIKETSLSPSSHHYRSTTSKTKGRLRPVQLQKSSIRAKKTHPWIPSTPLRASSFALTHRYRCHLYKTLAAKITSEKVEITKLLPACLAHRCGGFNPRAYTYRVLPTISNEIRGSTAPLICRVVNAVFRIATVPIRGGVSLTTVNG